MKGIGTRIKAGRVAAGLTQERLAEKVGISSTYLSAIECNVKDPKLATFIKIANAIGASADDLLADVLASVDGKNFDSVKKLGKFAQFLRCLNRQLPGGTKNDRLYIFILRINILKDGNAKGSRFPCTRLSLSDHILSFQKNGNSLCLDRRHVLIPHLRYRFQNFPV